MVVSPRISHRGSSQLRVGRHSERNRIYHISSATLFRRKIFESLKSARILIRTMRYEQIVGNLDSLAFVVMPDHFHWLISLKSDQSLSTCIGRVKSCSARKINEAADCREPFESWTSTPCFRIFALGCCVDLISPARRPPTGSSPAWPPPTPPTILPR